MTSKCGKNANVPTIYKDANETLLDPDNLNHSHQITQSEKMLIIATRRNGKLYLLAILLQFGTQKQLP